MTQKQIELVKSTWSLVATMDPVIVGRIFFDRLFEIAPEIKHMFHNPIPEQSKKLLTMLHYIIVRLDRLDEILAEVAKLSQRHTSYGVKPDHYVVVGEALLWTLEKGLGENWNREVKDAWTDCYRVLSTAMINASEYEKQNAA